MIRTVDDLRERVGRWRRTGQSIVLVPTMGNLHAGHLSLVQIARGHGARVIVSIFVNPLQFGPNEDFDAYPRTLEDDLGALAGVGADAVFHPDVEEMYPDGGRLATTVRVRALEGVLCGRHRDGHFAGVATVVTKLFNLVQPDTAVFGSKDFQQLVLIRRLVRDLGMPVRIVAAPTVREPDGLAMSSRNRYLDGAERARAPTLFAQLCTVRDAIRAGRRDYAALCRDARRALREEGFDPDYLEVVDGADLHAPDEQTTDLVIAAAARLGKARLIDNVAV